MANVYVNSGGVPTPAKEIFINSGGIWTPVKEVWIKQSGTWVKSFPESSGSVTYTSGTGAFLVPNGIYTLNVSYPTPNSIVSTQVSVTPGSTIGYSIGSFGSPSTFASINTGVWDKIVGRFAGNVDMGYDGLVNVWGTVNATGSTYSGSGGQATLYNGALAAGCFYQEIKEYNHGDLSASITLTPAASAYVSNSVQVYLSAFTGRDPGYGIVTQPSVSNSYRATIRLSDSGNGEGYYTFTMNLQQQVPITVSW